MSADPQNKKNAISGRAKNARSKCESAAADEDAEFRKYFGGMDEPSDPPPRSGAGHHKSTRTSKASVKSRKT